MAQPGVAFPSLASFLGAGFGPPKVYLVIYIKRRDFLGLVSGETNGL